MTLDEQDIQKLITTQWATLSELTKTVIRDNKYLEVQQKVHKDAGVIDEDIFETLSFETLLTLLGLQTVIEFNTVVEKQQSLSVDQKKLIANEMYENLFSTLALDNPELTKNASITQEVLAIHDIAERLTKLPQKVRDFILSNTTHQYVQRAVTTAGLDETKAKLCIEQIVRGATGLATTQDFKTFAATKLSLDAAGATKLIDDVTQNIFNPIREVLLSSLGKNTEQQTPNTQTISKDTSATTDPYKEQVV